MIPCSHPRLQSVARRDYCPDCQYEFYYGDAHATGADRESRLINKGRDVPPVDRGPNPSLDDDYLHSLYSET